MNAPMPPVQTSLLTNSPAMDGATSKALKVVHDATDTAEDAAPGAVTIPRKRPKPGERRAQILQTLAHMLEQPGAERITTAALAARLKVSEAALYRHFASKAQMFEGLIEFIEQTVFGLVNQITGQSAKLPGDGLRQTRQIVVMLLQFGEKNPGMARVMVGDALVFELSKCQRLDIRARSVSHLRNIDEALAARVADGLGMALPEHGMHEDGMPKYGVLVLGEMGIANTTSAAALMRVLTGTPVADCVGRGTGVDDAGIARKCAAIHAAVARHGIDGTPLQLLARYGGFEIAMMAGAMLGAASKRQVILIDGFIATAAIAVAARIAPAVLDYCVFGHVSAEAPHRQWLKLLEARPLLDLGMRLGEGSGAMLALPLLRAACAILSDMATFQSAGVSGRDDAEAAM